MQNARVEYAVNTQHQGPFSSVHFYVGAVQALFWAALSVGLVHQVLSFTRLFEDLDVNLPAITIAAIHVAMFVQSYWYLAVLPLCLWPFLNWAIVSAFGDIRPLKWFWYLATWSVPLLLAAITVLALFLPLIGLHHQLT